jgi:PKD repeat protein
VTFNASNSTDDGATTKYQWDFDGDGQVDRTTSSPTVIHAYQARGTVTAQVTVVDNSGQTASAQATIDACREDFLN